MPKEGCRCFGGFSAILLTETILQLRVNYFPNTTITYYRAKEWMKARLGSHQLQIAKGGGQ